MPKQRILLVEDDMNLGFLLMEYLESEGYEIKWCRDALTGLQQLKSQTYHLSILDIMMPGMDGFNLARHLKQSHPKLPFLFLTARLLKSDKLKAYALGAEDYLTKPFDEDELLCKIRVILRRHEEASDAHLPTQFTIGDYFFDYERQELRFQDQAHRLTEKENEVLCLLCRNKNRILKREEAVETIYGKNDYFLGRSFDVFISRLRKLLRHDETVSIENVFRVGFILNVEEQ
ncbi:DNA-binding response regulator [Flavilitoribacter nigricans DSM 23189 = NBRC 102662]|uniref:DNA-binding response regulator n=1 Tax=Flavilitoribacter nigricans (strain ATCC 23147 / DSM 23189 / NBRC 102662 / NCIMB 1420 / SS-2) TaxID=1122177 RepID=A0A2D0N7Z9_FLAN2|nr:DNA-binding response regulator [Flavilitoribacter nigricans DSM 23189 = NBRC 102662]